MLKSPTTNEIDVVLLHCKPCDRRRKAVEASRFLATKLWMCAEQNMTVGVAEREGRRSRPRTISRTIPPRTFACGLFLESNNHRVGLEGVLVEQYGEVRVANVCNELIRDVLDMITGFLKNNRMELSTGRRNNIGGVLAHPPWIPLKNRYHTQHIVSLFSSLSS